ncbi:hypothetical protein FHS90_003599 [Rufibacter quisquiliarum]|uniref:Uncharacterized protein n=2 Tax=Rufibacter quisquiliarum TaxID=1549639 RepID=A0A839GQ09_9BACT|nr:hypothetical protein [Rufibacter ruber]MBA9078869.1 hypothetical protein [Rufibacter quisquiliarum]
MNTTYTLSKVVRTWLLLLSVPLYMGTAALWMKEEIKFVLGEKEETTFALSQKEEFPKPVVTKVSQAKRVLVP